MCSQPPLTPEQAQLDQLLRQRERLLRIMTSGVQEVEQPQLGRTQYRTMEEVEAALRYLDGLIAQLTPGVSAQAARSRRRPIYPVVTEI